MRREVARRGDDRRPLFPRHANPHHVAFDEFHEMNPGIEAGTDEIHSAFFGGGDVEPHIRIVA
jgi:hypothetical protein